MLRQGPIPAWLHGILEYAAGVLCIVAPFVLTFQAGAAKAAAIVIGMVVLVVAATSTGPTSLVNQLPIAAHVMIDFVLAGLLVAIPFIFGFSAETRPTIFFIALGVAHLLITIATRFLPAGQRDTPATRDPRAA